ncbi:hypothetical protein PV11_07434 [Exophiala sideris]|uniref:BZIP domain-containing protein n=1 Tax=Exophiala sideris TaxID=1016849 RepID=A0A0D1YYP0_9EURO|nr:hypothetical protein PV11_07434 [Exophiala sideris]
MGRAQVEDNDWYGVQDPRKRKQIQDRLAQRARRKRLAEAKSCSTSSPDAGKTASTSPESSTDSSSRDSIDESLQPLTVSIPRSPGSYPAFISPSTKPDTCMQVYMNGSVFTALFQNGAMMGLVCSSTFASKSTPFGSEIPATLRPTTLQINNVHPSWIDRFPFPKMRDNMITLLSVIDEEEFMADLFCMTSFTVDAGAASWDPRAWRIGKEFSAKWGYLFY